MAAALTAVPAAALEAQKSSPTLDSSVSHVEDSVVTDLDNGTLEMQAPDGAEFEVGSDGAVNIVDANGDSVALSSTISVDGTTYRGDWSTAGNSATFAVTSTQNSASLGGGGAQTMSGQGCAECVVRNSSEATLIAAIVGIATGPGNTVVIPVTMVASLAVFGISCITR